MEITAHRNSIGLQIHLQNNWNTLASDKQQRSFWALSPIAPNYLAKEIHALAIEVFPKANYLVFRHTPNGQSERIRQPGRTQITDVLALNLKRCGTSILSLPSLKVANG